MDLGAQPRGRAALARWLVVWIACAGASCQPAPASSTVPGEREQVAGKNSAVAMAEQPAAAKRANRNKPGSGKGADRGASAASVPPAAPGPFPLAAPRLLTSGDGELVHDFGTVPAGRTVRHVFAFQWEGPAPLLPTRLRSDCGCLSAVLYAQGANGRPVEHPLNAPLPLHAQFVVEIELDTRAMGGPSRKSVTLFSEEPPGVLRMAITGEVR